MSDSKAYQTVIAGRVREDEGVPFFGLNQVAVPSGIRNSVNLDASEQPSITSLPLFDQNVGKKDDRASGINTYDGGSYATT